MSIAHDKTHGSPSSKAPSDLNKPLPSPPAGVAGGSSPLKSPRCLLDASEQPLKRSSPGKLEEDWPALAPERPAASKGDSSVNIEQVERYPKRPDGTYIKDSDAGEKKATIVSARRVQRKKVSSGIVSEDSASIIQGDVKASASMLNVVGAVDPAQGPAQKKFGVEEPCQIHTSSLRAERAAASVSYSHKRHGRADPIATDWAYKQPTQRTSRANIGPPANFVGGRRRSAPRRPDSRGSNQGIQNISPPASSVPVEPSTETVFQDIARGTARRRSSIPILRAQAAQSSSGTRASKTISDGTNTTINVFEDTASTLDTIQGSPTQDYHTKRLSMTSPTYGPVLRISRSAEDVIMGAGSDKENEIKEENQKNPATKAVLTSTNRAYPAYNNRSISTRRFATTAAGPGELNIRSTNVESLQPSNIPNCIRPHSEEVIKPKLLEDPFLDQPIKSGSEAAAADDGADPFKSTVDEVGADAPRETIPVASLTEGEALESSNMEWISPVAREARTISMESIKPVPKHYSPPVPPKKNEDSRDTAIKEKSPEISKCADASSTLKVSDDLTQCILSNVSRASEAELAPEKHKSPLTAQMEDKNSAGSTQFPPRSSSRTVHYTLGSLDPERPELKSPTHQTELGHRKVTERETLRPYAVDGGTIKVEMKGRPRPRESTALESTKSSNSISKGVISNIRGLFHKRSAIETDAAITPKPMKKPKKAADKTPTSNVHLAHRPTASSTKRSREQSPFPRVTHMTSPAYKSPAPSQVSSSTTLAMHILESARNERSSPKKERLLELGKIMVDTITQARDAERAMEEAKHATRKAEFAYAQCTKSVGDVARCVVSLRNELVTGHLNSVGR